MDPIPEEGPGAVEESEDVVEERRKLKGKARAVSEVSTKNEEGPRGEGSTLDYPEEILAAAWDGFGFDGFWEDGIVSDGPEAAQAPVEGNARSDAPSPSTTGYHMDVIEVDAASEATSEEAAVSDPDNRTTEEEAVVAAVAAEVEEGVGEEVKVEDTQEFGYGGFFDFFDGIEGAGPSRSTDASDVNDEDGDSDIMILDHVPDSCVSAHRVEGASALQDDADEELAAALRAAAEASLRNVDPVPSTSDGPVASTSQAPAVEAAVRNVQPPTAAQLLGVDYEDDLTCTICYDLITCPMSLGCGHAYCAPCITDWLRKESVCPHCRKAHRGDPAKSFVVESIVSKFFKYQMAQLRFEGREEEALKIEREREDRLAAWELQVRLRREDAEREREERNRQRENQQIPPRPFARWANPAGGDPIAELLALPLDNAGLRKLQGGLQRIIDRLRARPDGPASVDHARRADQLQTALRAITERIDRGGAQNADPEAARRHEGRIVELIGRVASGRALPAAPAGQAPGQRLFDNRLNLERMRAFMADARARGEPPGAAIRAVRNQIPPNAAPRVRYAAPGEGPEAYRPRLPEFGAANPGGVGAVGAVGRPPGNFDYGARVDRVYDRLFRAVEPHQPANAPAPAPHLPRPADDRRLRPLPARGGVLFRQAAIDRRPGPPLGQAVGPQAQDERPLADVLRDALRRLEGDAGADPDPFVNAVDAVMGGRRRPAPAPGERAVRFDLGPGAAAPAPPRPMPPRPPVRRNEAPSNALLRGRLAGARPEPFAAGRLHDPPQVHRDAGPAPHPFDPEGAFGLLGGERVRRGPPPLPPLPAAEAADDRARNHQIRDALLAGWAEAFDDNVPAPPRRRPPPRDDPEDDERPQRKRPRDL